MNENEIHGILENLPNNRNIEINVSCPNVDKESLSSLEKFIKKDRKWCIIKISPTCTNDEIDNYYEMGFRQFHCCNTIPVKEGGLSGISLIPYTTQKVKYIREKYNDTEIIAGGGIKYFNDILHYRAIGANHFSISTLFLHPILFSKFYYHYVKNN
jgi:dihydroorotate dehydrogenase